jgi:hypothetical protein
METIQLNLNRNLFFNIVSSLNESDKFAIYQELKKNLFLNRFERLLSSLKTDDLSLTDISNEVASIRKERYETRKQVL